MFDDGSPASGAPQWAKEVLPTTTALEGNPIEAGGVIPFGDLVEMEMDPKQRSYAIEDIVEATKHKKRWRYLVKWKGYDECSWINEDQITGTDEELNSSINVAQLRYQKHVDEIANKAKATRERRRLPIGTDASLSRQYNMISPKLYLTLSAPVVDELRYVKCFTTSVFNVIGKLAHSLIVMGLPCAPRSKAKYLYHS